MRAVRYLGPGKGVEVDPRTTAPSPQPGEALVRTRLAGIAATDLAACGAGAGPEPMILGREFVGIVEEINAGPVSASGREADKEPRAGGRVTGSAEVICGRCDLCRRGLSAHCRARSVLGEQGHGGCF